MKEAPNLMSGNTLNATQVDLIFASSKLQGNDKLLYPQFGDAITKIAAKKYSKTISLRRHSEDYARVIKLLDVSAAYYNVVVI